MINYIIFLVYMLVLKDGTNHHNSIDDFWNTTNISTNCTPKTKHNKLNNKKILKYNNHKYNSNNYNEKAKKTKKTSRSNR